MNKNLHNRYIIRVFIITISLLVIYPSHAGKIYKWVDENGRTQFSSTPPDDNKKIETVGKTKSEQSKDVSELLIGQWEWSEKGESWKLNIGKSTISFSNKPKNQRTSDYGNGLYKLKGKTIEVGYRNHSDQSKVGSTEKFYINKVDDDMLVLSGIGNNIRLSYRRNIKYKKGNRKLSGQASRLLGRWENTDKDRKIVFSNTNFQIDEKIQVNKYNKRYKLQYGGKWDYKDPYIELDVRNELAANKRDSISVMKNIKFYVLEIDDSFLKIRNEYSRIEKFVKK